jgi:hypothetical protein
VIVVVVNSFPGKIFSSLRDIAAILIGKAPASKTIVAVIIILFERIGQYDGAVSSCELGGTSGEGVQWTVDKLDSGGGLMTNKNKSLASESNGDVFVGTIPSLGHSWGDRRKFIGSKTKLFEKVFSQEFWNLKLF